MDEYEKEDDLKRASLPSIETPNSSVLEQKRLLGKSLLSQSLFNVEEDYFSLILFNKVRKYVRRKTVDFETPFSERGKALREISTRIIQLPMLSKYSSKKLNLFLSKQSLKQKLKVFPNNQYKNKWEKSNKKKMQKYLPSIKRSKQINN